MLRHPAVRRPRKARRATVARARRAAVEALETRQVLSTFTVTSLDPAGAGSLRQAIVLANQSPGPDTIDFAVAGTIRPGRASLPAVTDRVTIDGASAPGYSGAPVVTVDFRGGRGFVLGRDGDGSVLRGLSIIRASGAGVTLIGSHNTVQGNYIGLAADGSTLAGNRGDGVSIRPSSHDNLIGRLNPVSSIDYYDSDAVSLQPVSGWQGIRASGTPGQYIITGTSESNGLLYQGPITGAGGTSQAVNVPGASSTSVYGPDLLPNGQLRLVGSYRTGGGSTVRGFIYQGAAADLSNSGNFHTFSYPNATFTYFHSTMGDLVVGNADGPEGDLPLGTGHAFIYDARTARLRTDVVFPGSLSTTAYGIWHNGGASYTIAGGFTRVAGDGLTVSQAYLVDYDSATGAFSRWTAFADPTGAIGEDVATHFEGISGEQKGVYTLSANSIGVGSSQHSRALLVRVARGAGGAFDDGHWLTLDYPGLDPQTTFLTNNSVAGSQVVGIGITSAGGFSYQASVNVQFQLSNVISGNGGNGVGIYGSHGNKVAMNNIGADATGALARGNGRNGVFLTDRAARNQIGGQSTGGNDPTAGVFVRPPQGNLISANHDNGVLINDGATHNTLSGNFIGTTASGNAALGNHRDGVAIERADGNALIGCTFQQSPFVFYNVVSGNGENGLRITSADDTTVQANFLGIGADNATIVANGGDGLLVNGTSRNTQVGGVIPLGNVISGNNRHGIEVADRASGLVSFNTFCGVFAFGAAAPNQGDGILITSSGGDNLIRTCIVSGNVGHGIELAGDATGVQITDTAVGTDTNIQSAIPNQGDGIRITGNAHHNAIGGFQPSIEPEVTVSGNHGYGIRVMGRAHDNAIFHTFIGTRAQGTGDLGNQLGGVALEAGSRGTILGGDDAPFRNRIANSGGNGVSLRSSRRNRISGNEVFANHGYGLQATGNCAGSVVRGNRIIANTRGQIDTSGATGVIVIGPNGP